MLALLCLYSAVIVLCVRWLKGIKFNGFNLCSQSSSSSMMWWMGSESFSVVGVSFDNDDGTSRQDIISGLSVGEALLLNYHEYENEPAYAVTDALGNCIGHVSKELAATIYQKYKDCYFAVSVDDITGGDSGLKYGCVISIDIYDSAPETNENESSTAATVVDVIPAPVQNAESSKTNRVYSAMLTVIGALLILVGLVLLLIAPLGGAVAIVGGVFSIIIGRKYKKS